LNKLHDIRDGVDTFYSNNLSHSLKKCHVGNTALNFCQLKTVVLRGFVYETCYLGPKTI